MNYAFSIPFKLFGYRASLKRAHDPAYKAFKLAVRSIANQANVPYDPPEGCKLHVTIHWAKRARIDAVNVYKALEDSIWTRDRRCLRGEFVAHEHVGREYAVVLVEA